MSRASPVRGVGPVGGRRSGPRDRTERGGITVLAVACIGVLLLIGCGLAVVAAMITAHRSAQAAADLAALGAATALQRGGDACGTAAGLATENRATLLTCRVDGRDVVVEVEVAGPRWLGQDHDLAARARAGPA